MFPFTYRGFLINKSQYRKEEETELRTAYYPYFFISGEDEVFYTPEEARFKIDELILQRWQQC